MEFKLGTVVVFGFTNIGFRYQIVIIHPRCQMEVERESFPQRTNPPPGGFAMVVWIADAELY